MQLARVDGVIVSTVCHPSMRGCRHIICQPLDEEGRNDGSPVLALDPLGAGLHETVMFTTDGSATRAIVGDEKSPLRNCVLALVDPPLAEKAGAS